MNRMNEVAKMFDVELGEKFYLKDYNGGWLSFEQFYFSENGLVDEDGAILLVSVAELLTGRYLLEKTPFKPKRDEKYYYADVDGEICTTKWWNFDVDFYRFNAGNCFKKEIEITDEIKELILKEMKGKYNGN